MRLARRMPRIWERAMGCSRMREAVWLDAFGEMVAGRRETALACLPFTAAQRSRLAYASISPGQASGSGNLSNACTAGVVAQGNFSLV